MNIEKIDEPIRMLADFSGGKCRPVKFSWKNRSYTIEAINAQWIDRQGGTLGLHFSLQARQTPYGATGQTWFVHFNINDVQWWLDQIVV